MADQDIRDKYNQLVAKIRTLSSGKREIRDSHNNLLGTFDPKTNQTRDSHNNLVAKGDALTSLIGPF